MNRRLLSMGFVLTAAVATAGLQAGPVAADTASGTSNAKGHSKKLPAESGCNDVIGAVGADYVASTGHVRLQYELAAPACATTTYTFRVYDGSGTLATFSASGDGVSTQPLAEADVAPGAAAGSVVGVEVTTSVGGVVIDTAPNPVALDGFTDQDRNGIQDNAEVVDGASPALNSFS